MSLRFMSNLLVALAGGFVVVCSEAFSAGVTGWIALGTAIGILAGLTVAQLDRTRSLVQRCLDAVVVGLGIWTIIASVVFAGATLTWLSFAEGLGFVGLAVAGLMLHELSTERIVHTLAPVEGARRRDQYAEAA